MSKTSQCHFSPSKIVSQLGVIPVPGKREQILCSLRSFPLVLSLSRLLVSPLKVLGGASRSPQSLLFPRMNNPSCSLCLPPRADSSLLFPASVLPVVYLALQWLLEVFSHWNNLHVELADLVSLEFLMICFCSYSSILLSKCRSLWCTEGQTKSYRSLFLSQNTSGLTWPWNKLPVTTHISETQPWQMPDVYPLSRKHALQLG